MHYNEIQFWKGLFIFVFKLAHSVKAILQRTFASKFESCPDISLFLMKMEIAFLMSLSFIFHFHNGQFHNSLFWQISQKFLFS